MSTRHHILIFYVPASHLEAVKDAVFTAGAGKLGNYDQCCWQVLGTGQFRPLPGSDPFLGETGQIEDVDEYRVELICADECVDKVLAALKHAHPYETPAYACWPVRV
jgi:hypothetical protein